MLVAQLAGDQSCSGAGAFTDCKVSKFFQMTVWIPLSRKIWKDTISLLYENYLGIICAELRHSIPTPLRHDTPPSSGSLPYLLVKCAKCSHLNFPSKTTTAIGWGQWHTSIWITIRCRSDLMGALGVGRCCNLDDPQELPRPPYKHHAPSFSSIPTSQPSAAIVSSLLTMKHHRLLQIPTAP